MPYVTFVTDFADQAVVLPIVAFVAIALAAMGHWRGAAAWLGVISVTLGLILLLKVGFLACEPVVGRWNLRSPSGHTAAASVVAGGLAALMTGRLWAALLVATLAAAAIGASRVALGLHSPAEVWLGAAAGLAGAAILSRVAGPMLTRRRVPLLAVACALSILLHGFRLPAEAAIWQASTGALDFVPACRGTPEMRRSHAGPE